MVVVAATSVVTEDVVDGGDGGWSYGSEVCSVLGGEISTSNVTVCVRSEIDVSLSTVPTCAISATRRVSVRLNGRTSVGEFVDVDRLVSSLSSCADC